jgi:hypothetical protein
MALTYTQIARVVAGNFKESTFDFTADATYSAGGYLLATGDLEKLSSGPGATTSSIVNFDSEVNAARASLAYDRANGKIMFLLGGTEATTTASTATIRATIRHSYVNHK